MPLYVDNLVADKSYDFANRIVKAYRYLNLYDNDYIDDKTFQSILKDAQEIVALLVTIVKNAKENKDAQQ